MQCSSCHKDNPFEATKCIHCGNNLLTGTSSAPLEIEEKWSASRANAFGKIGGLVGVLAFIAANKTILESLYLDEKYVFAGALVSGFVFRQIFRFFGAKSY